MQERTCTACGQTLPVEQFYFVKTRGIRHPTCKTCSNARKRQWEKDNPERARACQVRNARSSRLRRSYGLVVEAYDALADAQGHRCGICGTDKPGGNSTGPFPIDHDHETGVIRGLLCNDCNVGLGLLGDDAERLHRALAYLAEPPATGVLQPHHFTSASKAPTPLFDHKEHSDADDR